MMNAAPGRDSTDENDEPHQQSPKSQQYFVVSKSGPHGLLKIDGGVDSQTA